MLTDQNRMALRFLEEHRQQGNEWVLPRAMRGLCDMTCREHPDFVSRRYSRGPTGMIHLYTITDAGRKAMGYA